MAFKAFTKVLVRHGKTAFEGLFRKGDDTLLKVPKQLPQVPQRLAKLQSASTRTEPAVRDWVRHYAWQTLAADLRKRAAWQITAVGRGGKQAFAEGQRWLLFPAYAFVGLSLSAGQMPSVSAHEVDKGFNSVTEQIKCIFGPGPKDVTHDGNENRIEDCQSGHLIARGSRVALYKVDVPKPAASDLSTESRATVQHQPPKHAETSGLNVPSETPQIQAAEDEGAQVPEIQAAVDGGARVNITCKEKLPTVQMSSINVNFTTTDGKAYQICLHVSPQSSTPVTIHGIAVDGAKLDLQTETPAGTSPMTNGIAVDGAQLEPQTETHAGTSPMTIAHIEKLLCEAMKEEPSESCENIQKREADMLRDSYVLSQYESLSESAGFVTIQNPSQTQRGMSHQKAKSASIEVISDSKSASPADGNQWVNDVRISPPVGTPAASVGASSTSRTAFASEQSVSDDSDIVIIDETVELDLQHQNMDEPIYLDDLDDDPLSDLSFLDESEAMSYLQNGYEGGYLLMTYFPYQEDMTSLSLPDTGENLWDVYEELFISCDTTPTTTDKHVRLEAKETTSNVTMSSPVSDFASQINQTNTVDLPATSEDSPHPADELWENKYSRPPDCDAPANAECSRDLKLEEHHDTVIVPMVVRTERHFVATSDASLNWEEREPSRRPLQGHPHMVRLPGHMHGALPLSKMNFDGTSLKNTDYNLVTTLADRLTAHSPGLLESVVLFTQLSDAIAHLDEHAFIFRDLTAEDILLSGQLKWTTLLVVDFGGRLYDHRGPRHLSYRDAVVNCLGNCSAVQPEVLPGGWEPGDDDKRATIRNLARLGLEIFGCRNLLSEVDALQGAALQFPSCTPSIFQQLLQTLMKPDAYKKFDAKLVCSCLHLLLWCPQRYFETSDHVQAKFLVTRWLTTFSAVTLIKRSSQVKVGSQEELKLQMKCLFLSTLDPKKLSEAIEFIVDHLK